MPIVDMQIVAARVQGEMTAQALADALGSMLGTAPGGAGRQPFGAVLVA